MFRTPVLFLVLFCFISVDGQSYLWRLHSGSLPGNDLARNARSELLKVYLLQRKNDSEMEQRRREVLRKFLGLP
uniref:Chalcone_isomerase domain-containing protein n=1 Tax=Steinernema glaseri TaxID=37863 RepID=A0A1I8AII4_9BILA